MPPGVQQLRDLAECTVGRMPSEYTTRANAALESDRSASGSGLGREGNRRDGARLMMTRRVGAHSRTSDRQTAVVDGFYDTINNETAESGLAFMKKHHMNIHDEIKLFGEGQHSGRFRTLPTTISSLFSPIANRTSEAS